MSVKDQDTESPTSESKKSSNSSITAQLDGQESSSSQTKAKPVNLNYLENEEIKKVKCIDIKLWPGNPRRGDISGIAESIRERGQFRPLLVQASTKQIIAGNQTFQALKKLRRKTCLVIFLDVDDELAKEILVADNRFGELGHNDAGDLYTMLKSMENPSLGTGYDDQDLWSVYQGFEEKDQSLLGALARPTTTIAPIDLDADASDDDASFEDAMSRAKSRAEEIVGQADADSTNKLTDADVASDTLQRRLESHIGLEWPSDNYWGIPTLKSDMLVQSLPADLSKFDTWGGGNINSDDNDPDRWWFYGWDFDRIGVPFDRSILHFFIQDERFQVWLDDPALYIAKAYSSGIRQAVTPDISYYTEESRFRHLETIYISNWIGRLMQEGGIEVIPRLQWTDIESLNYALLGIPEDSPVVAIQMQTVTEDEAHEFAYLESFRLLFQKIKPKQLLVYTGPPGRKITERMPIPKDVEVVYLENFNTKRRIAVFGGQK